MPLGAPRAGIIAVAPAAAPAGFPTVEAGLSQGFLTPGTSHPVNMPATVNSGDLLILAATSFDFDNIDPSMATPSGWTVQHSGRFSNTRAARALFFRVADGTEGGATVDVVTADTATMAVNVYRISGWHGTLSGVEVSGPIADTLATTHDPPLITASWGAAKNLFIELLQGMDDDATLTSASTNYGNPVTSVSGAGADAGCCTHSARRELEAASDDPDVMTVSQLERCTVSTIVVRPA